MDWCSAGFKEGMAERGSRGESLTRASNQVLAASKAAAGAKAKSKSQCAMQQSVRDS